MKIRDRITDVLGLTDRKGIDGMIGWLEGKGFFESPASTKYHGCYPGGLADHSWGVYELLSENTAGMDLDAVKSAGQKPLTIEQGTLEIAALLHDVCKVGAYIDKGDGAYKWHKGHPKGHASLSIKIISEFIELSDLETMMIRYHMGVYGLNEFYAEGDWQTGEYALRGDHSKDKGMTKEESQAARYGNSMANAWFHNPIVKVIYFCDELATPRRNKIHSN